MNEALHISYIIDYREAEGFLYNLWLYTLDYRIEALGTHALPTIWTSSDGHILNYNY